MTTINDNESNGNSTDEIKILNELFAKRYTDEDEEYTKMSNLTNAPPIVDDWNDNRNSYRSRQFNNNNQQRYPSNNRRPNQSYHSNDRRGDRQYQHNYRESKC